MMKVTLMLTVVALLGTTCSSQTLQKKTEFQIMGNSSGQVSPSSNGLVFNDQVGSHQNNKSLYNFDYLVYQKIPIDSSNFTTAWADVKGDSKVRYLLLAQQIPDWSQRTLKFALFTRVDMEFKEYAYATLMNNRIVDMVATFAVDSSNKTDQNLIQIGAVTREGNICFWNFDIAAKKASQTNCATAHAFNATCIVHSSENGELISGGGDSAVRVWKDGKATFSWLQSKAISALAIWKTGVLLVGDVVGNIKAYNTSSKAPYKNPAFSGHTKEVLSISFSSKSQYFASCSKDGYIILWDLETGKLIQKTHFAATSLPTKVLFYTTNYHPQTGDSVEPSELLYSSHQDGKVILWEVSQGSMSQLRAE